MSPVVLAFDLSSTATGACFDDWDTFTIHAAASWPLLKRAQWIAGGSAQVVRELVDRGNPPSLIVLEAIGTRFVATAIAMGYVHALVEDACQEVFLTPVVRVPPKALKKFATNNGNADKAAMLLGAVKEGWEPPEDADDNQADAWWLWALGKALLGVWVVPGTAYRKEVLEKVREGVKP